MKYILLLLSLFITTNVYAQEPYIEPIKQITKLVSQDMGYNKPEVAIHILGAESGFYPLVRDGDMKSICERTGKPIRARGLAQITECWHPEVTDEQAYDVEFSIRFLIQYLKDGKCSQWSTCPL